MPPFADVCVLIPTLEEAETIGAVVDDFRSAGFETILVIDGGSTDGTQEEAASAGAEVMEQSGSGKGQAVREAVAAIELPFVLLVDGDGTYRAEDAHRMLEPLLDGETEHVIGDRFADMHPDAMTRLNRTGNRLINWSFQLIHGAHYQDILSGYRAFTTDSFERMNLTARGFGIETEMAVECVKQNIKTAVVPITYQSRPAGSETNLRPFWDGFVIVLTLYRLARMNNPLFYFGSVGVTSILAGGLLGAYVGFRWFLRGVSHEVLAVVAAFAILLGVQLIMFGLLSDLIVSLHREQMRRLDEE